MIQILTCLGYRKPCQLHQLVERPSAHFHEVFVEGSGILRRNCLYLGPQLRVVPELVFMPGRVEPTFSDIVVALL